LRIPPLPEIDLARIAPLSTDQKRRALEQMRLGRPPYSYAPMRGSLSDLTNVQADLAGPLTRTPWDKVANVISRASRSDAEESANLRVAQGLFDFAESSQLIGRRHDIFPLALGVSTKVTYWQPAILTLDGRPVVPFYDPRRAKILTADARRFVFSVMHERIRAADPDFSEVGLAIFQFAPSVKGPRTPIIFSDTSVELFTFDDLDEMVSETYRMWQEICEDRAADMRRKRAGGSGGFL
jgi:hypothetical protein